MPVTHEMLEADMVLVRNRVRDLEDVIRAMIECLERYGNWDDGCFYYAGRSASELQEPLLAARDVLEMIKTPA